MIYTVETTVTRQPIRNFWRYSSAMRMQSLCTPGSTRIRTNGRTLVWLHRLVLAAVVIAFMVLWGYIVAFRTWF